MGKIWVVTKREFISRVRRKAFIWATALAPLGMLLYFGAITLVFSYKSDDVKKILVCDESSFLSDNFSNSNLLHFAFSDVELKDLRIQFDSLEVDAILHLPEPNVKLEDYTVYYYSHEPLDLAGSITLQGAIRKSLRDYKIKSYNLDPSILKKLETSISIDPEPILDGGEDSSAMAVGVASVIGTVIGIIMFMVVMIYGMMVMRSVMEEKVNRIVEIIISSLRPIELMIGKILGVGLVGLAQMTIWALTVPLIMFLASVTLGLKSRSLESDSLPAGAISSDQMADQIQEITQEVIQVMAGLNWWFLAPAIFLFFIMGYFLYASLFAALGSAIGDEVGEGQALTIPITIPLILAFYIMFVVVQSPNSSLAVFSSLFPLFSPLVMPARLVFQPPLWQVALSIFFLLATIALVVWFSARIYRIGILMYGKKASLIDIARWLFSNE